jgi:hypothetical protein
MVCHAVPFREPSPNELDPRAEGSGCEFEEGKRIGCYRGLRGNKSFRINGCMAPGLVKLVLLDKLF